MKIGFFTDTYLPVVHGVEISLDTFKENLRGMGHQVFIYAPEFPDYEDKDPHIFRFPSIRVIEKPEMRVAIPFSVKDHLKDVLELELDIVHAHTPFSMGWLAKYTADRQHIPLVYTHHTRYAEYAKHYLKDETLTPFLAEEIVTWYANLAEVIIAPSHKIKEMLKQYGVEKRKPIFVVPTGVDLEQFAPSAKRDQQLRKELEIAPNQKVLLFVGRMGGEKNLNFLLRALNKVLKLREDVILLMVGDGPVLDDLKQLAQEIGIEREVKFTGRVPHEQVPKYYQAADLFWFSSLTDTQGIVILEAIGSGLPVVALKDDAFKGMIIDDKNGFLVSQQLVEEFAKRTSQVLEDSTLHKRFSGFSREIAKKFSEQSTAQKLLDIYREAILKASS